MVFLLLISQSHALSPDKGFHQYVIDRWSIEEGLAQITASAIVQGPKNRIWIGTQAGVAHFDGVRFTNFDPENTPELPGSLVQALFVDSRQRLWIGTYKGVALFESERFDAISAEGENQRPFDVYAFTEAPNGDMFAATDQGLLRISGNRLKAMPGLAQQALRSATTWQGSVWLGAKGRVLRSDESGFREYKLGGRLASAWVTGFAVHLGTLWAATDKGLLRFQNGEWRPAATGTSLDSGVVEAIYVDRNNNLWASVPGNLSRLRDGKVVETIPDQAPYAFGGVLAMTEDHEGNLWMGSRWHGVARLWDGWVYRYGEVEGLHNPLVWSVAPAPDGSLWVGTMDGLSRFDNGRFQQILQGSQQPHPHAYTLLPETSRVWVGTRAGLIWWDIGQQRINTPEAFQQLAGTQINGIIRDSQGDYWLGTTNGVWHWDETQLSQRLSGLVVRVLLETADGDLLAGSQSGLFRLSAERFERVEGVPETADITGLTALSDGRLVAGSLGERLFVETHQGWADFGTEDGLPSNSAFAFGEHAGMLWVGGIRGIYRLPVVSIEPYLNRDIEALPGRMILNERGDITGAQKGFCCNGAGNAKGFMRDGGFWLPSRGGLVHVVPDKIEFNSIAPQVLIDRYRVDGQWYPLEGNTQLSLDVDQRDIAIGFTALSFQDPESVQMQYRLLGYSEEWVSLDDVQRRTAFFTNLPAGVLELQVRGSNNAGVWSESSAVLTLSVKPYFWETTWFRLLMLALALLTVWLGYRFQLRKLRAQQERLEAMVAERTEELRVANESLVQYSQQLEEVSNTDALTGLWNRRYLLEQLPKDLAHFNRELASPGKEGHVMAFALVDLDYFKTVNDTHGHAAGDEVLKNVAKLLVHQVREGDYVVRWGGEEFLIVFRPMAKEQPPNVAERIRSAIEASQVTINDHETLNVTCSLGFSEYPLAADGSDKLGWEEIVELADQALYYVKENGRNGWCIFRPKENLRPGTLRSELNMGMKDLVGSGHINVLSSMSAKPSD